jgi:hypothetical protein
VPFGSFSPHWKHVSPLATSERRIGTLLHGSVIDTHIPPASFEKRDSLAIPEAQRLVDHLVRGKPGVTASSLSFQPRRARVDRDP